MYQRRMHPLVLRGSKKIQPRSGMWKQFVTSRDVVEDSCRKVTLYVIAETEPSKLILFVTNNWLPCWPRN